MILKVPMASRPQLWLATAQADPRNLRKQGQQNIATDWLKYAVISDNTNNFTLQGHEPPHFTGFFGAWDRELFKVGEISVFSVRILEQNRTLKFDQNLYPTHFIRLHLWMR